MWINRATPAIEFWLLCSVLPWSIDWGFGGGMHLHIPAEPLVAWVGGRLLLQYRLFVEKWQLLEQSGRFALVLAAIWLGWGWVCVPMSSMVWVSFKYMLVATAHAVVFMGFPLLYPAAWKKGLVAFLWSLTGVAAFSMYQYMAYFGLRNDQANLAPMPFFDDHTVYACVLLLAVPLVALIPRQQRALALLLVLGIVLSTCRAAWASAVLAIAVVGFSALWHRSRWAGLSAMFVCLGLVILGGASQTERLLRRDVSGSERLNRYHSAFQMAAERPWVGFGPGTYAYQYLPFQAATHRTRISLDQPIWHRNASNFGHGGGAHSEYLQALSETGWIGMLLLIVIVLLPVFRAPQNMATWLALYGWVTYWIHSLLNNFWHDPRAAYLIWGIWGFFIAQKFFEKNKTKPRSIENVIN